MPSGAPVAFDASLSVGRSIGGVGGGGGGGGGGGDEGRFSREGERGGGRERMEEGGGDDGNAKLQRTAGLAEESLAVRTCSLSLFSMSICSVLLPSSVEKA